MSSKSIQSSFALKTLSKVDIFFIDDDNCEGDFHKGSLLMSEHTIERGVIDRRIYYLLCSAFIGMGIPKHQRMLRLEGKF